MPSPRSVEGPPEGIGTCLTWTLWQTDTRVASIEVKIKKLDGELGRYKEQMSKLRNGPGKVCASLR